MLRAALGDAAGGALQRLRPRALGDRRRRNGRGASLLTEAVLAALAARVRTPPRPSSGRRSGGLEAAVARAKAAHPGRPVEVWAADEHRLGLKCISQDSI